MQIPKAPVTLWAGFNLADFVYSRTPGVLVFQHNYLLSGFWLPWLLIFYRA
jgi:hypothetical protein